MPVDSNIWLSKAVNGRREGNKIESVCTGYKPVVEVSASCLSIGAQMRARPALGVGANLDASNAHLTQQMQSRDRDACVL